MTKGGTDDIVQNTETASVEEFLSVLDPIHRYWEPDPRAWIFRGQADSRWKLQAKAYRDDAAFARLGLKLRPEGENWSRYGDAENDLLDNFGRRLDAAGLPTPHRLPRVKPKGAEYQWSGEVRAEALPLLALAQHVGLPTSLLDWSRVSLVAAYFGAADAAANKPGPLLEVWALNSEFLAGTLGSQSEGPGAQLTTDGQLSLESAPAASNPNLHAQMGVFTRYRGARVGELTVDELVTKVVLHKAIDFPRPIMRRIRLPAEYAPRLLRVLAYKGINGSTMFPGYAGVVKAMGEEVLWDQRPDPD